MKKILISTVAGILALLTLVSCTPASQIIPTDTEEPQGIIIPDSGNIDTTFKDYVVCSKNFVFYAGEYNYFFMKILTDATKGDNDYDIDLNKSLKEQYVGDSDKTWFDIFKELTLDYMKELLYVYEKATAADEKYSKAADEYIYDYIVPQLKEESDGNPTEYVYNRFGGAVQYQNYLNALAVEYIYDLYTSARIDDITSKLTEAEIKEYADSIEGEKNTEKTRRIMKVYVPKGKLSAEELKESFTSGGEQTAVALEALAKEKGYSYYYETLLPDGDDSITDWTFKSERAVGDTGITEIVGEGYYVLFYIEEGEEVYLLEAKLSLANKSFLEELESGVEAYGSFKVDKAKLNEINT